MNRPFEMEYAEWSKPGSGPPSKATTQTATRSSSGSFRKVSPLFLLGIVFVPYVFSLLTLQRGYSTAARVAALIWAAPFWAMFVSMYFDSLYPSVSHNVVASQSRQPTIHAIAPRQYHYITGLDPNGDNWLALRSEPSLRRGSRLMKMGPETLLSFLERKGTWVRVRTLAGDTGWASSRYIACCRNATSAASANPKPEAADKQPNEPTEAQAQSMNQGVSMDLATSQVMSKQKLEAVSLDADGARYQDVLAHKATDNGVTFFAFCGEINGHNAVGGYTGYQRFVATPWVATTEGSTVGFDEIWQRLCLGPSSEVWF